MGHSDTSFSGADPSDSDRQHLLVTHAVLAGLTPLVPVPWVDDQLYLHALRSMMQRLGAAHGRPLSAGEIEVLVAQQSRGCALGCLGNLLLYPVKKLLRKLFFFLEWKRAVDTISYTYCLGYLLDAVLAEGWLERHGPTKVRAAIDTVLARTNTSVVSRAVLGVVSQSKTLLQHMGTMLTRSLSGIKASSGKGVEGQHSTQQDKVAEAVAGVQDEESAQLGGLISQLQQALSTLPNQHLQQVRQELAQELSK